jgi:hypothetical protein
MTDKEKAMELLIALGATEKNKIMGDNLLTSFTLDEVSFTYSTRGRRWLISTPAETLSPMCSASVLAMVEMASRKATQEEKKQREVQDA